MRSLLIFNILLCSIPGFLCQYRRHGGRRYKSYLGGLCDTPDSMPGSCKPLNNCPTIYNPFTHQDYLYQAHRRCGGGYAGDRHLVCCSPYQRPPVDPSALASAEKCLNSASQRGVCIPLVSCESIFKQISITLPQKLEKCFEESTLICCPLPNQNTQLANDVLFTMEEGCGENFSEKKRVKRIIGGQTSQIGNWPWIALLGYNDRLHITFSCGGALISNRHVLTAAHCLKDTLEFVRLGEHDLTTDEETEHLDVQVLESFPHPEYNNVDSLYDIAVVHLFKTVEFTKLISPICLPLTSELQHLSIENTTSFVSGWGKTMEKGSSATILQNVEVQVYNNSVCKEMYEKQNAIRSERQFSEVVLCAGDLVDGKDACKGDSGGPIMMPVPFGDGERFVLIGLVSYGIGCGRKEAPSVNTNVMNLMPWIRDRVAKMK